MDPPAPILSGDAAELFNSNRKYQIIASDIIIDSMEEMDETQPFHALAKKIIRNLYNGSYSHKAEMVGQLADILHPDAVISSATGDANSLPEEVFC